MNVSMNGPKQLTNGDATLIAKKLKERKPTPDGPQAVIIYLWFYKFLNK